MPAESGGRHLGREDVDEFRVDGILLGRLIHVDERYEERAQRMASEARGEREPLIEKGRRDDDGVERWETPVEEVVFEGGTEGAEAKVGQAEVEEEDGALEGVGNGGGEQGVGKAQLDEAVADARRGVDLLQQRIIGGTLDAIARFLDDQSGRDGPDAGVLKRIKQFSDRSFGISRLKKLCQCLRLLLKLLRTRLLLMLLLLLLLWLLLMVIINQM